MTGLIRRTWALAAAVCLAVGPAWGAEDSWHAFGALDYLAPGSASKQTRQTADDLARSAIAAGFTRAAYTSRTDGAFGFRVGALKEMDGLMVGPSLGYLYGGPNVSGKVDLTSTPAGTYSIKQTNHTVRLLAEAHKKIPLSDPWSVMVGGGFGWAVDAYKLTCEDGGALAGNCAGVPQSTKFGWATWELSPAIAYQNYYLAVRYAGFARGGFTPWNTYGVSVGAHF